MGSSQAFYMFNKIKPLNIRIEEEYLNGNYYKVSQLCDRSSDSTNLNIINYKACALFKHGHYTEAIDLFNRLIELAPNASYAYFNRASALDEIKQYPKAIKDYNKALNFDLNDPDIYSNRAVTKFKSEDFNGALKDLGKAIKLNPKDPVFYFNRFYVYTKLNQNELAIEDLHTAAKLGFSKAKNKLSLIS